MKPKRALFFYAFVCFSFFATSQTNVKQQISVINYSENVNTPFTIKEISMLKELYKDTFEEKVLNNSPFSKALKNLLRNRLEIKKNS